MATKSDTKVPVQKEPRPTGNPGKTNESMLKLGRNRAKIAAQKRG